MVFNFIFRITGGMNRAAIRFPFMVLMGIAISVLLSIQMDMSDVLSDGARKLLMEITSVLGIGISVFFTAHLVAENNRDSKSNLSRILPFIVGFLLLVALFITIHFDHSGDEIEEETVLKIFIFAVFTHMLVAFFPVKNRYNSNAFWQYNKELFIRILTTALYCGVLYLGLAGAIMAMDVLFKLDINYEIYAHLWFWIAVAGSVFIFGAGIRPDITQLDDDRDSPKGIKLFAGYILLPLVVIYMIILYLYGGKIMFTWSLPVGWVGNLIMAFSVVGILALLLLHPFGEEEGNSWIKRYTKTFYYFLFPLLLLLFVGIYVRIDAYGVTVVRYLLASLGVWLLFIALFMSFKKNAPLFIIPASLAVLAMLVLYTPYLNAYSVAERSQKSRLIKILTREGFWKNGSLVNDPPKVLKDEVSGELYNIVNYLVKFHFTTGLEPKIKYYTAINAETLAKIKELSSDGNTYYGEFIDVSDANSLNASSVPKKEFLTTWQSNQILEYELKRYGIQYHYMRSFDEDDEEQSVATDTASVEIEAPTIPSDSVVTDNVSPNSDLNTASSNNNSQNQTVEAANIGTRKFVSNNLNSVFIPAGREVAAVYNFGENGPNPFKFDLNSNFDKPKKYNLNTAGVQFELSSDGNTLQVKTQGKSEIFELRKHFTQVFPQLQKGEKITNITYENTVTVVPQSTMILQKGNLILQFHQVSVDIESLKSKTIHWNFHENLNTNSNTTVDYSPNVNNSFTLVVLK
jgi:hypothetical protein